MTIKHYPAKGLAGGGADDLDFVDGDGLADDDVGITIDNADDNLGFLHRLEASSGATEVVPAVVSPNTNAGDKRWLQALLLAGVNMANVRCGQLQYVSATALKLLPCKGNQAPLYVNGIPRLVQIPAAGLTLNITDNRWNGGAVAASTFYLIYLEDSGGTKRLIGSTTAHATDSTTGHEIMSGDVTRTLVGAAYVSASSQFTAHLVLSWHNRRRKVSPTTSLSSNRTRTETSPTEVNSEIRNPFACWADTVRINCAGYNNNSGANNTYTIVDVDGVAGRDTGVLTYGTSGGGIGFSYEVALAEGYHYATLAGFVAAGTGTWLGSANANAQRCTLQVSFDG